MDRVSTNSSCRWRQDRKGGWAFFFGSNRYTHQIPLQQDHVVPNFYALPNSRRWGTGRVGTGRGQGPFLFRKRGAAKIAEGRLRLKPELDEPFYECLPTGRRRGSESGYRQHTDVSLARRRSCNSSLRYNNGGAGKNAGKARAD